MHNSRYDEVIVTCFLSGTMNDNGSIVYWELQLEKKFEW